MSTQVHDRLRSLVPGRLVLALAVATLLAGIPALADPGGAKGKPPKEESHGQGHGQAHGKSGKPSDSGTAAESWQSSGRKFSGDEARIVRDWFGQADNLQGLPPGLAKRETLPPGLRKQLRKNGKLPPGLESKLQPLPEDLVRRLPRLPDGVTRTVAGRDILLVDEVTKVVRDILHDAIPR